VKPACECCGRPDAAALRILAAAEEGLTEWPDDKTFVFLALCPRCRRALFEVVRAWPQLKPVLAELRTLLPQLRALVETAA
jgi:hypothetical protein